MAGTGNTPGQARWHKTERILALAGGVIDPDIVHFS
jgi:hypothetical protein